MVQPLRAGELGHALIGPIPSRHTIAFRERESGSNHFPARQPSLCQVPLQTNVDRCIVGFVVFCFDHLCAALLLGI